MGLFKVSEAEIERAASVLENAESTDPADVVLCLGEVHATVAKLHNGKDLERSIEKLLAAGSGHRAAELLRARPRTRRVAMFFSRALTPLFVVLFVSTSGQFMPRCDGAYAPAIEALNHCPAATEHLGTPIRQSAVSYACGESSSGGGSGSASWTIRVSGPLGSGTYSYRGSRSGGPWELADATLQTAGETLQIVPCASADGEAEAAFVAEGTFERLTAATTVSGVVSSVIGVAPVVPDTACTITVTPTAESFRANGYNCHVKVQCGTQVLYGWEDAGITHCRVQNGSVTSALDEHGASDNDDPKLDLVLSEHRLFVSDDGADATYRIKVDLSPR